uniref:Uncharacterized protein n=1 Tax=Arundo donax TaxID=35708 RepID=A0A0A8Z9Z1_ARUDO
MHGSKPTALNLNRTHSIRVVDL